MYESDLFVLHVIDVFLFMQNEYDIHVQLYMNKQKRVLLLGVWYVLQCHCQWYGSHQVQWDIWTGDHVHTAPGRGRHL